MMLVWAWTEPERPSANRNDLDPVLAQSSSDWRELRSAARPIVERLDRDRWAREVVPRVLSDHASGDALSMGWPDGHELDTASSDSIIDVLYQPDLEPVVEHDAAVGVHVVAAGRSNDIPNLFGTTFLGIVDGTPVCVRIRSFGGGLVDSDYFLQRARRRHFVPISGLRLTSPYRSDILGACTLVWRFGMPGPHVRAWFAESSVSRRSLESVHSQSGDPLNVASLLSGRYLDGGSRVARRRCQAGEMSACMEDLFPHAALPTPQEGVRVVNGAGSGSEARAQERIAGLLEAEFGAEAFLRFWSSDKPLETAFETAFGIHPADWVHRRATEASGVVRAGPLPHAGPVGVSGLLMVLGLAIGALAALRRHVA